MFIYADHSYYTKSDEQKTLRKGQFMTSSDKSGENYGFAAPRGKVYDSVLNVVGGTPLVALPHLLREEKLQCRLLLKLEFFNPLGSVKDRIGAAMVLEAEREGRITPGRTVLVEPTSGNTGISLAFVAAARGYRLIVTMPEVHPLSGGGCCA